jgi:Uma2 family endonuclease
MPLLRSLIVEPPLTDAEFEAMCRKNDEIHFERTSEGAIRMNPPAGAFTGNGNAEIIFQLYSWWSTHPKGRVAPKLDGTGPVQGFTLDLAKV